jgi:hypothetical protein
LTECPFRSNVGFVRGLYRFFVVGFTLVSLALVAAVGVAASAGKTGSPDTLVNTAAALVSGHVDVAGVQIGSATLGSAVKATIKKGDDHCKNQQQGPGHHDHATGGHEHHECDGHDDSS